MRNVGLFLVLLPLLACTYGRGEYKTTMQEAPPGRLVLKVESRNATSDVDVKRALLERAARATIDRGAIYLRVDGIAVGPVSRVFERSVDPVMNDPNMRRGDVEGTPDVQQALDVAQSTEITRIRDGSVTFSISRDPIAGDHVFEAARLLDQLRSGSVPSL